MGNKNNKEFMRIRSELFCQMSKKQAPRKTLPSLRKLAEEFKVTPPTVMRAVHSLIKDGYLLRKKKGYESLVLTQSNQNRMCIFGLLNASGNQAFNIRTDWVLNTPLMNSLFFQEQNFCTKTIQLDRPENLQYSVCENGLSGLLLFGPTDELVDEAWKLKEKSSLPMVAFYSSTRKISATGATKDAFLKIFNHLTQRKYERVLVILQKYHKFYPEIRKCLDSLKYAFFLEIREESESETFRILKDDFRKGKSFDAVIFFNFFESIFREISAVRSGLPLPEILIDQFSLTKNMRFTGSVFCFDLQTAARKLIENLILQRSGEDHEVFIPMDLSFIRYKDGIEIKELI